jgi:hypothetical protein
MTGGRFPGIIFVIRGGLRWRDVPAEYGPAKTINNRFMRWSRLGVFLPLFARLAARDGLNSKLKVLCDGQGRLHLFGGNGGNRSGVLRHEVAVGVQAVTCALDLDEDGMVQQAIRQAVATSASPNTSPRSAESSCASARMRPRSSEGRRETSKPSTVWCVSPCPTRDWRRSCA